MALIWKEALGHWEPEVEDEEKNEPKSCSFEVCGWASGIQNQELYSKHCTWILECVSPEHCSTAFIRFSESNKGSKALKRMRRAREDGHSWSFAPQLPWHPSLALGPGPTRITGWPKAMVQEERMEENEEGQRYWGAFGGKVKIKGKNVWHQIQS